MIINSEQNTNKIKPIQSLSTSPVFPAFSGLGFFGIWKQQNNQTLIYHEMLDLITMKKKYTTTTTQKEVIL